jgi:hypothetical protein
VCTLRELNHEERKNKMSRVVHLLESIPAFIWEDSFPSMSFVMIVGSLSKDKSQEQKVECSLNSQSIREAFLENVIY